MYKCRIVIAALASLLLSAPLVNASAASTHAYQCPEYPPNTTVDSTYEGSLGVSGLRKLADAEIKGKVQTQVKRFTANHPDANKTILMLALLAYNCRAIQESALPENKKIEAIERFNRIIMETLNARKSDEAPRPSRKVSPPALIGQHAHSRVDKIDAPGAPAPSLVVVAHSLQDAVRSFKGALHPTYLAALGGAYTPVVPYDLMLDDFMLKMASSQDFMDGIPNVISIPEESSTSLAYDMCRGLLNGESTLQRMFTLYNARVPEYLIQEIQELHDTSFYQYFSSYVKKEDCSAFQGKLKQKQHAKEEIAANRAISFYAIPLHEPKFTADTLREYITKVKRLDTDSSTVLSSATAKRPGLSGRRY